MKSYIPKSMFLTMSLLLGVAAQTQATPIIQVLSESLDVSYYVETESRSGTTIHSDSATGSLLGSGASVSYTEFYYSPSENENYVIDANGSGSSSGTNGFNLDAEADDYPFSGSGPFNPLTSVTSVRGEASTSWVFNVLNEDADFRTRLLNEVYPGGTPPPAHTDSVAEVRLFDVTSSSMVLDVAGGWGVEHTLTLLAGHQYQLYAIAGDYGPSDEDVSLWFYFDDRATITSVPEPSTLYLLLLSMSALLIAKRRNS